jgi:DNA-binding PucR family transcriptional regulator
MDFSDYRNLQYAYQQAKAAWRYASDRAWLVTYETIFGKYLLDTLKENHNLTHYCHSALLRFDRTNQWNLELLKTLKQYLLNGCRVSKTANDLHIHRNTMINRINIINGILGIDIDAMDEETVVHYLISLLIQDSDVIPK